MASFTTSGDNVDWLWGSLKPWQILHSTLAERERFGSVLDVWELVNETLSASTIRGQESGDGGRSHGMNFLGDIIDGDFWRHGGVMESRVKECLNALKDEEELVSASAHLQLPAAHHHHHRHHSLHTCNTQLAVVSSTQLPCAPRSVAWKSASAADADDQHYCKLEEHKEAVDQVGMLDEAAAAAVAAAEDEEEEEEEEEGIHNYTEEEGDEEEEDEEEDDELDSRSAPSYTRIIREANSSLIRSNYQDNRKYREINRDGASVLVINPCCSAVAAAAEDDQAAAVWANLAEGMGAPPDLEENIEVCAVCLEKLTHYYEEGVQALACRHAFHTVCIAPWLQRQPHACCPCCRAPIFPDNLAPPLHLAAPLDLAADHYRLHDRYACAGLHEEQPAARASNDIMGLLSDMEAALEHLGFRS